MTECEMCEGLGWSAGFGYYENPCRTCGGTGEDVRTDIVNCARCGGRHNGIRLKQFTRPVIVEGRVAYTHYAECPKMGQPILVLVTESDDE